MSITPFGAVCNPADGGTLFNVAPFSVIPPASMLLGDLALIVPTVHSSNGTIAISNSGGQSWNALTLQALGSINFQGYWCRFNGSWISNPEITSNVATSALVSLPMVVLRPTLGGNTWAVDVAQTTNNFSAPTTPFDVTAAGQTALASSTVTLFVWVTADQNTWGLQTAGFFNVSGSQYRNLDSVTPRYISLSIAYKIQSGAGPTGNVVNRQLTRGGDAGRWIAVTFKEQSSGVTVASVGDGLLHNGETGIVIAGTSFGATHTGSADVIISPSNNVNDAGAVIQTQTAWSATSVTFTAALGTFAYFTNLYVFVKDSTGASNSSGFVIQREAWANISGVLKTLAGATVNNATNVVYHVRAKTADGTQIMAASNGTTDGSGNFVLPTHVLTSGGVLAVNDNVWVDAAFDGASLVLSPGTIVKVTPTYS